LKKKNTIKNQNKRNNNKKIGTKFNKKLIWNQMLRDEIENKIQLEKEKKQTTIKKITIKFDIKIK